MNLDFLDVVIEPPFSRAQIAANIRAHPQSAAALVDLLPTSGLSPHDALVAESLAYGQLQGGMEHAAWLTHRKAAPFFAKGNVEVERTGNVLNITLNRPDAHNAIDRNMRDRLLEAFTVAALDRDMDSMHLQAIGKAFCIGGDLAEFGTTRDPDAAHAIRLATLPAFAIIDCAERMEVHVQGACIGAGLEMAAFARQITASADAWFQLPELSMGLIPGAGGCVSLPRRIGWQRTALLLLSGRRISAKLALQWGLIDAII